MVAVDEDEDEDEDEDDPLWYIEQRVWDEHGDYDDGGYPGIPGADLPAARATALSLFLEQNPQADTSKLQWVPDGSESWRLLHDEEDTGFALSHLRMWDSTTPYPEP